MFDHQHAYELFVPFHIRCSCGDIVRCASENEAILRTAKIPVGYDRYYKYSTNTTVPFFTNTKYWTTFDTNSPSINLTYTYDET